MFYFVTGQKTVKAKNLSASPLIAFHGQGGLDIVILEGREAKRRKKMEHQKLKEDYQKMNDYIPDWWDEGQQILLEATPASPTLGVPTRCAGAW